MTSSWVCQNYSLVSASKAASTAHNVELKKLYAMYERKTPQNENQTAKDAIGSVSITGKK